MYKIVAAKFAWLLVGVALNAIAATTFAWFYFSNAMQGFNTSQQSLVAQQQSLSMQMLGLQSSLDLEKQFRENKIDQAKQDLGAELKNLADVLRQNSAQLSSLNATISGMDKRLSESIERQRAFESTVMQRIVYQGPVIGASIDSIIAGWEKAGYNGDSLRPIALPNKNAIEEWKKLIETGMVLTPQK